MYKIIYVCLIIFTSLYLIQAQNQISTAQQDQNDINALNYALTLEHLESAYYNQGQNTFNVQSFVNAGLPASAFTYLNLIRDHEAAHVSLLQSALGSNAVPACTYNFTSAYSSVYAYIATARLLEETGVSAYDGAANTINSAAYLQTAATIATIEARHASYLNQLLSYIAYFNATGTPYSNISNAINTTYPYPPFPNAFDTALSPSAILTAAQSFILSCPANTTLPVIAFTLTPYTNFSNGYNSSVFNSSGQYISQLQFTNDNYVLNYSLSLELLGRAFYSVVATFTPAQFVAANFSLAVYNNVQLIIANELAHVNFLNSTLIARGAVPAVPCSYNIANVTNTVGNALAFARMLENMEVTAYDGAINRLTQYDLIQGAATIATVEARHGNYLNNVLNGTGVQTAAVDVTNDPSAILSMVAPYLGANCIAPVIPAVAYTLQQQFLANNVPGSSPPVGASNTFTYSSPLPGGGSGSTLKSFLSILL